MPPKQKRAQSKTADKVEKNETPQKQSARKANKSQENKNNSKGRSASKAKAPMSKAKAPQKQEEKPITLKNQAKSPEMEIVFKSGSWIAFVDTRESNDERFDQFCIGQVGDKDMRKGDAELKVHIYMENESCTLEFSQETPDGPATSIFDYQILGSIVVKRDNKKKCIRIVQKERNKFVTLFENQVDSIKEKLGIDDDDSESEEEEEEKKQDLNLESDSEKRVILVAKRTVKVDSSKAKPVAKSVQRKKKQDSDDDEDEDEASEVVEIGKKRRVNPGKQSQSVTRRVKKLNDGGEKIVPSTQKVQKPAKTPKWKEVQKIGKWNPNTVIVEDEVEKLSRNPEPLFKCCLSCNIRNVYRAIETKNHVLLTKLVYDIKNIPTLNCGWSSGSMFQSLMTMILKSGDMNLMQAAFDLNLNNFRSAIPGQNDDVAITQLFVGRRTQANPYLLTLISQGQVNYKAYGTAIRKVEMTRGNRQGNNAFLDYDSNYSISASRPNFEDLEGIERNWFIRNLTPQFYKALSLTTCFKNTFNLNGNLVEVARTGNRKLLVCLLEPLLQHSNFGFNQLHMDVLKKENLETKYATASLTKKANSAENVTPIHFACINPNIQILKKLLEQNEDINVVDNQSWKPLHYAAACEEPHAVELLLKMGASVYDITSQKFTALHVAAMQGRAQNIKLLLDNNPKLARYKDKQTNVAFVYSLILGEIPSIAAFLDSGAIKLGAGVGKDRMTPLHFAAAQGNYELVEYLLEKKAKVLSKDKYKRSPLVHACKNGHVKVASLLLQNGADWNQADSSQNYPLHYAAGYGWQECIDLLIVHSADINANNMWKVTPITVAMLKNHTGIVKELLKHEVDVNGKDDKGYTLLHMACVDLTKPDVFDFVQYLLEKGADPNLADLEGMTPLHNLAFYKSLVNINRRSTNVQELQEKKLQERQARLRIIELLISFKANLNALTVHNDTPFSIALKENQIEVLHKFADNVRISENPALIHNFTSHILDERYASLLAQMIQKEKLAPEVINVLDKDGFSPFLAFLKLFSDQYDFFQSIVTRELNYIEWRRKQHFAQDNVTNIHLFDDSVNSLSNQVYQEHRALQGPGLDSYFNVFELKDNVDKNMVRLIVNPFIKMLQVLVAAGADYSIKVDKMEFYRELDKHKQKLMLVEETREGVTLVKEAVMQEEKATTVASTTANKVIKKRDEVLAERNYEKKLKRNNKGGKGTDEQKAKRKEAHKQLKKFYAEKGFSPRFETINGRKIEQEYVRVYGQQNAIHLMMKRPVREIFQYLVEELKIPFDEIDNEGLNPVYIGIQARINLNRPQLAVSVKMLIDKGANFDLADRLGQTPFVILYSKQFKEAALYLLDRGANINAMSKAGVFALKMALIRRNNEEIEMLVKRGADINQIDHLGRNLLHEAVKMSSATADATFETEQLIINLGVRINLKDQFGRVPLHYAFVKNSRSTQEKDGQMSSMDPIETVSSLCAQKKIEIDVPDKWNKTPLHYASMIGSTISTIYLIQRGASITSVDIYGNTPLAVSMLYKQFHYAIILIQKTADVKVKVFDEFPRRIDKQWADEEKQKENELRQASTNVEMKESEMSSDKAHRELFAQKQKNVYYGLFDSDYDDEDDSEDSEESDGKTLERQVYNQNAFGLTGLVPMKKTAKKANMPQQAQQNFQKEEEVEPITEPKSTFRHAIRGGQQGVAYLILDNGYDYMLAMQDAMDESKFQLVLTLLSKTSDDNIIKRQNDKGQNLMHILAQNAKIAQFQVLERIYQTLKQRGVDCLASDNFKNSALHYAVQSNSSALVKILIKEGINVNDINSQGNSPLSLFFISRKTTKGLSQLGINSRLVEHGESIIEQLGKAGADFNVVYEDFKEVKNGIKSKPDLNQSAESDEETLCMGTILINQIKYSDEFIKREEPQEEMNQGFGGFGFRRNQTQPVVKQVVLNDNELIPTLDYLVKRGATFDIKDNKGRDVMSYAIENNDIAIVKFLLNNAKAQKLLVNSKDNEGKTAVHYVVNPIGFGSYENVEILVQLHQHGYKLDIKDNSGQTPLDYANQQSSGVLASKLSDFLNLTGSKRKVGMYVRQNSFTPLKNWEQVKHDPEEDSQMLLKEAEEKEIQKKIDEKPDFIPLDTVVKNEKQYKVYYDQERRPFDCYLTKVDLANGLYGAYVFYKMQMLYDTNRDLYIVLTRYGRIGETGMSQRSPFNNVDDAIADFSTIFKQKTGNDWTSAHLNFTKMPKKYNLVQVHHSRVKHQDYLAPFDFENCKESTQLSKQVKNFVEEICNVTMYQKAIQNFQIDMESMPISSLKRETLLKAKDILAQIKEILQETFKNQQFVNKTDEAFEEKQKQAEVIGELSSKYFELIPFKESETRLASPIKDVNEIKRNSDMLELLMNVEFSSRILLGALYRQYEVNPIDYIYECMAAKIMAMSNKDPETILIRNYCENTAGQDLKNIKVFKIERKGEAERFAPFKKEDNRILLFHGSAMSNYMGILSQGLRIAPPEAPTTGYMFGKGVYFADQFKKSSAYAHGVTSRVLILCEVALGKMKKLYEAQYVENLEKPFLSVKGCGRNGPDLRNKLVITSSGFAVPTGLPIKYPDRPVDQSANNGQINNWQRQQLIAMGGYSLLHNEYIVYNTDQIRMRYLIQVDTQ